MKKNIFKRVLIIMLGVYVALFAARAVYDMATYTGENAVDSYNTYYTEGKGESIRNYASLQMEFTGNATAVLEQKYERISSITARTVQFDTDMERFDAILDENQAVVQMEDRRGLAGSRRVDMIIGVRPDRFDAVVEEISKVGRVTSSNTTSTDKTYEYRQMLAEKETLEHRLASYQELKERSGSISELLQLEDKIIEVEAAIQQQNIGLGEYSDENALCTVNYTLYEGSEAPLSRKLWNALTWSTGFYLAALGILLFVCFVAFIITALYSYVKRSLAEKPATGLPPTPVPGPYEEEEPTIDNDPPGGK